MTPREIIAEAWALTRRERMLRRWGYFTSFFETLLTIKLIGYQLYFLHAYSTGSVVGLFDDFEWAYEHLPFWFFLTLLIGFGILLFIEFIFPNLATGAIIGLAAKSHKKEEVNGGLVLALYNFFPILAIHEFLILSSWTMTLSLCSLIARYIPGDIKVSMIAITIFFFILSNILRFFFSFAQPAVVIQRVGIFEAMGQSFKLIVSYLGQVMFLMLLLLVISLRVLLNTLIVLIMPAIVVGIAIFLTIYLAPLISYLIAGAIGIAMVIAASYFFGYLHVFQEAVWTITYIELKKNKDLDVIEA